MAQKRSEREAATSRHGGHHKRCACCRRDDSGALASTSQEPSASPRVDSAQASAIYEKQVRWKHAKEANDSRLRSFYNELAQFECTFKNPLYKGAWETLGASNAAAAATTATVSPDAANAAFFVRTMQWATQREARLAEEKKIWDEIRHGECTFQPKVASPRRYSPSSVRATASPAEGNVTWSSVRSPSASPRRYQDYQRAPCAGSNNVSRW